MYIGKNIRYLRTLGQHTQKGLADMLGKKPTAVGSYEDGKNLPPIDVMVKLCDIYDVSLDQLVMQDLQAGGHLAGRTAERTAPYGASNLEGNERLLFELLKEKFKAVASELKQKDLAAYKRLGLEKLEDW